MYERDEYFLWWSPFYILLRLSDFLTDFSLSLIKFMVPEY